MSIKDTLINLTNAQASGEAGLKFIIEEASTHYRADASISPLDLSDFVNYNKRQKVMNLGGYLVAHKQFSVDDAYSWADTLNRKGEDLILSANKSGIVSQLRSFADQLEAEDTEEQELNLALGKTARKDAETLVKDVSRLKASLAGYADPEALLNARKALTELSAFLDRTVTVKSTNQVESLISA